MNHMILSVRPEKENSSLSCRKRKLFERNTHTDSKRRLHFNR